jgi:hypothetical protein
MNRLLFTLILLVNSASASDLNEKLFDHLCNGGLQRRKLETSWVSKVDTFAGERLDIVQEKQEAQRKEFRTDAEQKWGKRGMMVPQREHIDTYAESCLPQFDNDSEFLGYREGNPVISTLFKNQGQIWGCYAMKNTQVLQEDEKFTARLDLNRFCKYARPADSFLSK